jgi:hypothetical protein
MPNIANTTITERIINGKLLGYSIDPNEGYVLHDKNYDVEARDEVTHEPTGEILLGYLPYPAGSICGYTYDFDNTTTIDGYTAYGSREFFARPQSEVPENQIFTVGNDHEVM